MNRAIFFFIFFVLFSATNLLAAEKISDSSHARILEEIDFYGEVPVIVELSDAAGGLSPMANISDDTRNAEIAGLQEKMKQSLSAADQQRIVDRFQFVPGLVMKVDAEALERLRQNAMVKNIYENGKRKASLKESTKLVFSNQATSKYTGNNEWTVAVLDTGVDKNHSFLNPGGSMKVVSEACYSRGGYGANYPEVDSLCPGDGYSSTLPNSGLNCSGYPGCDHGTHVAGIAAGSNSTMNGVARQGRIMAVQVFTGIRDYFLRDVCGTGVGTNCIAAYDIDILHGLERVYALRNLIKIASVNMSLGGGYYTGTCDTVNGLITATINNLKNAGIATVVASGNEYNSYGISFPACISNAIAVGATFDSGGMVDQATSYGNQSPTVDLYAPGSYIYSSVPGGGFSTFEGTSMAAPHVAGAWAVLKHANPSGTVDEFEALLDSVGPNVSSRSGVFTRRRLDVQQALQLLVGGDFLPFKLLLLNKSSEE